MLPNFRRSEQEASKPQAALPSGDNVNAFPARPFLATPRTDSQRPVSVVGADLTITGSLVSKGEIQVDGMVEGDIQGSHVIVGESATINGNILADEVVIRGHVIGSVRSKRVMLQSTSQVDGDIFHQSLSIEQGALFEGKSRRTSDDPRTVRLPGDSISLTSEPPRLPELTN